MKSNKTLLLSHIRILSFNKNHQLLIKHLFIFLKGAQVSISQNSKLRFTFLIVNFMILVFELHLHFIHNQILLSKSLFKARHITSHMIIYEIWSLKYQIEVAIFLFKRLQDPFQEHLFGLSMT